MDGCRANRLTGKKRIRHSLGASGPTEGTRDATRESEMVKGNTPGTGQRRI